MKPFVLNREKYKQLKKMDHSQMSDFCIGLCKKSYAVGLAEGATSIVYAIEEGKIKGIGKTTAKKIQEYLSKEE